MHSLWSRLGNTHADSGDSYGARPKGAAAEADAPQNGSAPTCAGPCAPFLSKSYTEPLAPGRWQNSESRGKRHSRPRHQVAWLGEAVGRGAGTRGGCWQFGASSWSPIPIPSREPWCSTALR